MEPYTKSEVDERDGDGDPELVNQDVNETCLEDVRVEEHEKHNDHREQDTDVLNSVNKAIHR